ncbi:MAG: glucose-6-phosphate isomerase [Alphaproteobacteria bacterium]|nr:glucose-6-phosphate isomerase [Alphaproteobacteria bacterium]
MARAFDLRRAFAQDPCRAARYAVGAAGLYVDYSKNLVDDEALAALAETALAAGVPAARESLFAGGAVNASEGRPALHTALREAAPRPEVAQTLGQMERIAGAWRGQVRDVVHIGIGGSILGPRLACEALQHAAESGPRIRFASGPDPRELGQVLAECDPRSTALILVSKSFTTPETLAAAAAARAWAPAAPVVAATGNAPAARALGIRDTLDIPPWVGGRYSLWGAAGLALAVQNGFGAFAGLLSGARAMDAHFRDAPLAANAPMLLALLSVWYRNAWGRPAAAVIPYAHGLRRLAEYVQQLEMESNGKGVTAHGAPVERPTAPVVFGGPGTAAQHAIGQRLHQGPGFVPVDFVVDASGGPALAANALAQAQALMEGLDAPGEPHRACPGGRPSTTIVLPRLDAPHLGALLALYEHKVFVESVVWGVNAFDQWGVELGKRLAGPVEAALATGECGGLDASTAALVEVVRDA